MKKYLYLLLMPLVLTLSCNKPEPEPEPVVGKVTLKTEGSAILSDEGDSKQVAFSTTLAWTATSSESWLTVEPGSGQAGDATIILRAGENPSYDARSASVTITCDKDSKTIEVVQKQKGALLLTDSTIPVAAEGGPVTIVAKANSNVSAAIDAEAKDWIVRTKALVDYTFEFSVLENTAEESRSGKIVFSNEAGSETVTIEQAGKPAPANITGKVLCSGAGVPDVLISDGVNIVKTDAEGKYRLQSEKKWKYVFMTIPSGYEAPLDGILPEFWKELKADADTEEEVDFELVQAPNENYTLFVLGDMHLARRTTDTGDLAQFEKVAEFLNTAISEAPGKVYCLTLGDMTWDMYWLKNNYGFADYLETMNGYFTNVPFFHTMGNHDNEMEKAGDWEKAFAYTENIAPDYYSFNLGKIHYIVMDDMDFTGVEAGEDNRSKYAKNFTAEQLAWLKKDLSYVDKSTPVFVTAHEPLARPSGIEWKEQLNGADADLDTFIGIFDGYNVRFLSGHTHNLFNKNWSSTFVEHNSGAICASWWWSGHITPGIHIAQDGAPGGYTVWTVNGTELTHYYQAALQNRDYQFRAYDMNSVKATITEDLSSHDGYPKYYNHIQGYGDNEILVNVWDYDEDWKVEISENGTPLEVSEVGVYDPLHIYAMTIPRLNKWNTTTFSTAKWCHFFKATASAADTPVTVKVTDRYGNVFTENMTRPKAFTVSEYKNEIVRTKPVAEFVYGSSSSVIFGWTTGCTAAEDAEVPYKLELFKDAACSDLQVSFDIPAEHSCWGGNPLRFTFGGLQPATSYWFKVTNMQNGDVSEPVEGRTAEFTVVDPATVTNAKVGDVVLAEDFSEVAWGPDEEHVAAGFFPSEKLLEPVTGAGEHEGGFQVYNSTSRRVFGDTKVTSDKRLYNWGFFGNSAVYAYNGHLRVCTTASGARTHIVSPALSGIPEGKLATVDVTVTACPTYSSNDVAVFVNDRTSLKLALAPDQKESTSPSFSSQGGKYTGASLTDGYALDQPVKELTAKTVRIEGVTSNSCLIIGSYENVDTKNRFWLDDVKVQIVSLEDPLPVAASLGKATSCSLTFTWTEGVSASDDIEKPWTIALYRDEACTDLVVSHIIDAGSSKWSDKQPRFIFGGLDPDTTYWFKATDTTEGNVKTSNVVKATTESFTRVDASKVSNAVVGDIILAEDFSETYGPDEWDQAAGFMPSTATRTLDPPSGEDPDGSIEAYSSTGTRLWGNSVQMTPGRRLANGWGFFGNSAVYSRTGYLRVATTSGRTHIVTPKLAGIPDGFKATISVTVTALLHEKASNVDVAVFAESGLTMNSTTDVTSASFCKYSGASLSDGHALGLANTTQKKWYTKTVEIEGVTNQYHLIIGSLSNVSSKNRFNLADVVVKIVDMEDPNRTTKVSILGDSISTFKDWCDETKGNAYYPKSDVTSVTDTWWHKLIYQKMSTGTYEKNISAGNTTIVQNTTGDSSVSSLYWYGWDFGTRLQQLGIGNPDVVCIFGGTNDYGHTLYNSTSEELIDGVAMGAESFPDESKAKLNELLATADAATTVDAADALDGTTFCSAYIRLIQMIRARHPQAKIVCIIGDYLYYGMGDAVKLIADHWDDVRAVDILGEFGYKANGSSGIPKYDYAHPNAAGMERIASFVYEKVGAWIDQE